MSPSTLESVFVLRPAGDEDREFLRRLYASTREEEMALVPWTPEQKAAFLSQQFEAQSMHYRIHFGGGTNNIIEVAGTPAGRLYVERRDLDLLIVDISIAPEFRGAGLGSRLISALQREAAATGKSITGHVERTNRACSFWRRMGFTLTETDGVYSELLWRPAK